MNETPKQKLSSQPAASVSTENDALWKVLLLGILTVFAGLAFWFFTSLLLSSGTELLTTGAGRIRLIVTFISFFLFIAFSGLTGMLIRRQLSVFSIMVLAALAYLPFFGLSALTLLAFLAVLVGLTQFAWHLKTEQRERLRFSVSKVLRPGIGLTITLLLVAVSLTWYAMTTKRAGPSASPLEAFVNSAANTTNRVLASQVPGYNPSESLDAFLLRQALTQAQKESNRILEEQGVAVPTESSDESTDIVQQIGNVDLQALFSQLPAEVRAQAGTDPEALKQQLMQEGNARVEQELAQARDELLSNLQIEAEGNTPMGEVIRQFLFKQISRYIGPYEKFLPTLLALSLYFTLQVFAFLYVLFITMLCEFLFWLLKAAGVVSIQRVDAQQEVPTLNHSS